MTASSKPPFAGEVRRVRLGDVCKIISGATPKTSVPEYWGGDINWITPADLDGEAIYVNGTEKRLTAEGYKSASLRLMPVGTVLLTSRAPIGKVAISGTEMCCNQGFKNLVCSEAIDNEFLLRYLRFRSSELQTLGRGATFKELSKRDVEAFEINLPPLARQRESVRLLSAIEHVTALARRQLALLDDLVKSRFVEMFESTEWPTVTASSALLNMRNGVSPSKEGVCHARVLTLSAITQGSFDVGFWKEGTFSSDPSRDKRVSAGEFYICRGNGNRCLVGVGEYSALDLPDLVFPDTMIAARINLDLINAAYLRYVWGRPAVRRQIESRARTTNGTFKINQHMLSEVLLPLPPLSLQREFAAFAAGVAKSQVVVKKQIDKLQTLYDSLSQRYFA